MASPTSLSASVTRFWREAGPKAWYAKREPFDADLRDRFGDLHLAASRGEFIEWLAEPEGALAYLLLTDQIPRNIFRGSAHAFATDGLARAAACVAVKQGHDRAIEPPVRQFCYMPFMHSESADDQRCSLQLAEGYAAADPAGADTLKYARMHAEIIERFGRFPHRNVALGRATTGAEQAFLEGGGFKG